MASIYDEVEIEDFDFDPEAEGGTYYYPCPCGDRFQLSLAEMLESGEELARCPSCSLMVRVIYDMDKLRNKA